MLEETWSGEKWPFQIFSDNFSVHITLIECNGLESNEKFFEKIIVRKNIFDKKIL